MSKLNRLIYKAHSSKQQQTTSIATAEFDKTVVNLGAGMIQNKGVLTFSRDMRIQIMVMLWIEVGEGSYKRGKIHHIRGGIKTPIADAITETNKYWNQVTLNTISEIKTGDKIEIEWGGSGSAVKHLSPYDQGTQINIIEI